MKLSEFNIFLIEYKKIENVVVTVGKYRHMWIQTNDISKGKKRKIDKRNEKKISYRKRKVTLVENKTLKNRKCRCYSWKVLTYVD